METNTFEKKNLQSGPDVKWSKYNIQKKSSFPAHMIKSTTYKIRKQVSSEQENLISLLKLLLVTVYSFKTLLRNIRQFQQINTI